MPYLIKQTNAYDPTLDAMKIVPITPTTHTSNSAATTNARNVKPSSGLLFDIVASNVAASIRYLKLYNKASLPTVGTDTPVLVLPIPAGGIVSGIDSPIGIMFNNGISYAITGAAADTDTTAIAAGDVKVMLTYI